MATSPVAVNVDLGIAETARLVDEIISRRRQRMEQVVTDVLDDVEAAVAVVLQLDKLFTSIVTEFGSRRVTDDDALLGELVDQTRKFLFSRELLPTLDSRREAIRNAAADTRNEAGKLRPLQPLLGEIADALDAYRANLDQSMGPMTAPGALGMLYGLANYRVGGGDVSAVQVREEAELTMRRHDFALTERISALSGKLSQATRGN